MDSRLASLRQASQQLRSGAQKVPSRNMLVRIEQYDLSGSIPMAYGHVVDGDGERVGIYLRERSASTNNPPLIEHLAAGHGLAPPVQPGGVVLFKTCYQAEAIGPNIWSSYWPEVFSSAPNDRAIGKMISTIQHIEPSSQFPAGRLLLFGIDNQPKHIAEASTPDELVHQLSRFLEPSADMPYSTRAFMRLHVNDGSVVPIHVQTAKLPNGFPKDGLSSAQEWARSKDGQTVLDVMSGPSAAVIRAEIMLTYVLGFGSRSVGKISQNERLLAGLKGLYSEADGVSATDVYVPTYFALAQGDRTNAKFITAVGDPGPDSPRYLAAEVPSPRVNVAPSLKTAYAKHEENRAAAATTQWPAAADNQAHP